MDATCRVVSYRWAPQSRCRDIPRDAATRCNDSRRIVGWKEIAGSTPSPPRVSAGIDAVVQACCKDAEQLRSPYCVTFFPLVALAETSKKAEGLDARVGYLELEHLTRDQAESRTLQCIVQLINQTSTHLPRYTKPPTCYF